MQHETHIERHESAEQSTLSIAALIGVCSEQLRLAIDDSRREMDGLTTAMLNTGSQDSNDVLTRLQSVDRFMQRLGNIKANLDHVAQHLNASDSDGSDHDLTALMETVRATFTMTSEREVFDGITGYQDDAAAGSEDDVVLF